MRRYLRFFFLGLIFVARGPFAQQTPSPANSGTFSSDHIRAIIRQAADKDIENDKKRRDYTYIHREEEHKLSSNGAVKSTESRTYEVMIFYEEPVKKLIAKNDKALSEKDAKNEEEKIQKIIDKREKESEADRRKRLNQAEKERVEGRKFVEEIADAYNFRFAGIEDLRGRETYVIDADPRPGYEPHTKDAKFLPKFRFRVWIDKPGLQWVKLDVQCIDTVSVGFFLARVYKGSNIQMELTRVNDEVWLPKHVAVRLEARIALLRGLNLTEDVTYRDYKKFRTETKIVPSSQPPQ